MLPKTAATTVVPCTTLFRSTVSDSCGNAASVDYATRIDNTAPVPVAGTIAACYPTQAAAAAAATAAPSATGNCAGTLTNTAATTGDPCSATITVTVSDSCGN